MIKKTSFEDNNYNIVIVSFVNDLPKIVYTDILASHSHIAVAADDKERKVREEITKLSILCY